MRIWNSGTQEKKARATSIRGAYHGKMSEPPAGKQKTYKDLPKPS
jgi:hypothetical protein